MTKVSVSMGYTRNMGNYESCRVDIGVEDDVRQGETVSSAVERVKTFVESKVIEQVNELEEEINSVKADRPVRKKKD